MTSVDATIAFVGGGNMGRSLIAGLIGAGLQPQHVHVADPDAAARDRIVADTGATVCADGAQAVEGCDLVVLAVKPQILKVASLPLAPVVEPQSIPVLSIAAGVSIARLKSWLGASVPVARAMPNTPALVGSGITGVFADELDAPARALVGEVLSAVGEVVWLTSEDQLHAVTAVSGSGPAYFFRMVEALQAAGVSAGLSDRVAARLASHTALGAGELLAASDEDAATLRRQVTSPKGTTERGLAALEDAGLDEIMRRVVAAARDRSIELGLEMDRD